MNLTYYGHSCFAVEIGTRTLLFDPFITFPPIKINHEQAVEKFRAAGLRLHLLKIGASHTF